ncbi:MAG: HAMP domain-containing histidine kinase [Planctomycetes bacterium]|nr:HAMP domain-containing histidine kinase [Planctomycetota bacterium]
MTRWLRGKAGGLLAFIMIAGLVAGGLGWVTAATLRLEEEQQAARSEAELHARLRLALWRLDSYMIPELAREASRPFSHYNAIYAPAPIFDWSLKPGVPGRCLEMSPLLDAELPDWVSLHFSTADEAGWWSPQVLSTSLKKKLPGALTTKPKDAGQRDRLLKDLECNVSRADLLAKLPTANLAIANSAILAEENRGQNRDANRDQRWDVQSPIAKSQKEFTSRMPIYGPQENYRGNQSPNLNPPSQNSLIGKLTPNGEGLLRPGGGKARAETVRPGPMSAFWLESGSKDERLVVARRVEVGGRSVAQGLLLNWQALEKRLLEQIEDLFPEARLQPMTRKTPSHPERTMTALPVELDPGPVAALELGWKPLRIGLVLAWAAALIALLAVGLGGWSLIDLSQRRIRFVSTVTHELRTPLTTLRLYLDMLTGGMVQNDKQRDEYLHTLNGETDRLNRLVNNVLDFSRLENQRPRLEHKPVSVAELLECLQTSWQMRCQDCGKDMIIENSMPSNAIIDTDSQVVTQLLGNLIDNACKYSQAASDPRLWLRARQEGKSAVFEVEDLGPGVPRQERRSIFRPFRRGHAADVTAGGVGLGLALAQRWASLLGGQLTIQPGQNGQGACFVLRLPAKV